MCFVQDDFESSGGSTEDDAEDDIGWSDRNRRESEVSIGSSVHSSLFGGKPRAFHLRSPCLRCNQWARDSDFAGTDTDTSIARRAPFGVDSDAGSVLSADSDPLPLTNVDPVPTLKGSNLNTGNGVGMPKFGLRGDDAGMFDLASDDDSDDGASRCQRKCPLFAVCSTNVCEDLFSNVLQSRSRLLLRLSGSHPRAGQSVAQARRRLGRHCLVTNNRQAHCSRTSKRAQRTWGSLLLVSLHAELQQASFSTTIDQKFGQYCT